MNKIESFKNRLAKRAVELTAGGFRPANSIDESWIGRVYLYKEDEEIPVDNQGALMLPLFQLCLSTLPFVPTALAGVKVLTVFISRDWPMDLTPNGENWLIREYGQTDLLRIKDLVNQDFWLKPFPLKPQTIEADYPVLDDDEMPGEIAEEFLGLEASGEIDEYYRVVENHYGHKIGGYPSFCQPAVDFGNDYEFVMQIASDEKAHLNIVDSGTIFLAKNIKTGKWKYYCDFF